MSIIELAKSSRATCRICKGKIEKLNPRLGIKNSFVKDGKVYESYRWHHLEHAFEKFGEEISTAEINAELDEETLEKIERVKIKFSGGLAPLPISDLEEHGIRVNTFATVLRAIKSKEAENSKGAPDHSRTVYVESDKQRRKVILWGSHVSFDLSKEDEITIIRGLTELGSDEKIMVNVDSTSKLLINASEDEKSKYLKAPKLFTAESWSRPSGKVVFEIAKTSRAKCNVCEEKILKGELKIVKPVWLENETTKQKIPGSYSLHLHHVLEDENGEDVLREAISKINLELIDDFRDVFSNFTAKIKNQSIKKELQQVLAS